ncbi:serine aminopeptidase domain-containing protein [Phenylobacterium sp.]|jgi:alpha-beta hydrolase superfamily lysophospholipase|uniref:serine aminopeptidase domain-containing protein n=1 Tax=Phenylobacterium sp. TaxID=1871053 RepID=UPI002F93EABC
MLKDPGEATRAPAAARPCDEGVALQAVTFDGHFGTLHRPVAAGRRDAAVLLCPPLGGEGRRAYRALFLLANRLARQGYTVLRYDHLGEGDSLPVAVEGDRWACWVRGVERAAAFARHASGRGTLVLAGLRLGASLAGLAAEKVDPAGLVLLAPIVRGRSWLREMQLGGQSAEGGAPGDLQIDGLYLSAATAASLGGFNLASAELRAGRILYAAQQHDAALAGASPAVERAPFPGYAGLFQEAHVNDLPTELFDQIETWLAANFPERSAAEPPALEAAALVTSDWEEQAIVLPGGERAILTLPARAPLSDGAIFCNTGADPRAGIGGFAATAARELASDGLAVLRLDFAGLGESPSVDAWRSHVFESSRTAELTHAVDLLRGLGCGRIAMTGVCSGAYHALEAALGDPRIGKIIAFNPRLSWTPGARLIPNEAEPPRARLSSLGRAEPWRRLLRGEIPLGIAARRLAAALSRRARSLIPARPSAEARQVRARIERFLARGGQLQALIGDHDEYWDEHEANFGPAARWLARRRGASVTLCPDLDHGLLLQSSRDRAHRALRDGLGLAAAPEPAASGDVRGWTPIADTARALRFAYCQAARSLAVCPAVAVLAGG